jgi:hypothetical protein
MPARNPREKHPLGNPVGQLVQRLLRRGLGIPQPHASLYPSPADTEQTAMERNTAEQIISAVEAAHAQAEHLSANNACKAAGVAFADYKAARLAVYGLNPGL